MKQTPALVAASFALGVIGAVVFVWAVVTATLDGETTWIIAALVVGLGGIQVGLDAGVWSNDQGRPRRRWPWAERLERSAQIHRYRLGLTALVAAAMLTALTLSVLRALG